MSDAPNPPTLDILRLGDRMPEFGRTRIIGSKRAHLQQRLLGNVPPCLLLFREQRRWGRCNMGHKGVQRSLGLTPLGQAAANREIARPTSPSGHSVSASYSIAATPWSWLKRKARSSSSPGWNKARARSRGSRTPRYSPANQWVMPCTR
jgi:hypothetical protein